VTVHRERRVKREINQQDATNLMFIIQLLSQHVSGIIMPIIRRTRPCTTLHPIFVNILFLETYNLITHLDFHSLYLKCTFGLRGLATLCA